MLSNIVPRKKLGIVQPLEVVGSGLYEFYMLAPEGVLLEMITGSLTEFSREDAEQSFVAVDEKVDALVSRHVDLIMQSGVPQALLIGVEKHDHLIERIAARSGLPATSSIGAVVAAARNLGVKKIVAANRWSDSMNGSLAAFFKKDGVDMIGSVAEAKPARENHRAKPEEGIEWAYQIGRRALDQYPQADGLYLGGSGWLAQDAVLRLEREFGKPVIANKNAMVWDTLRRVGYWTPIQDEGLVLAAR